MSLISVTPSLACLLIGISITYAQTEPPYHQPSYFSECWRGEGQKGGYWSDVWPDTGLFALSGPAYNEPASGYPMHSGIVKGVQDTVTVIVSLTNRNESSYDISSYQVDNWLMPVVFDMKDNPRHAVPLADTSKFKYSFDYWTDRFENIISQPDALPPAGGAGIRHYLTTEGFFTILTFLYHIVIRAATN